MILVKELNLFFCTLFSLIFYIKSRYFQKFWLKYYVKIDIKKETLETYAFLTFRDGEEIIVENSALKILISRYFTRINYLLRYGAFYIDNANGQVKKTS